MGMFDEISFKVPLPLAGFEHRLFQTKDLQDEPDLTCFMVTEDRKLVGRDGAQVNFTGSCRFYTIPDRLKGGWVEFEATFVEGTLTHIELMLLRKVPNRR